MSKPVPPSTTESRRALVAAAERLLARGSRPFDSRETERAAGVAAGSLATCFASREAFGSAVAAAVKRSLLTRWDAPAAPTRSAARDGGTLPRWPSRIALIEAGKRLLSNDRLDGLSIDGIVEEAGVGKGSFFNHFESRADLMRAVLTAVQDELAEVVRRSVAQLDDPVERIAHGFVASLRYGLANQLGARAMTRVTPELTRASIPLNFELRRQLRAGMAQGSLPAADLDAAAMMLIGLTEAGLMQLLDPKIDHERIETALRALGLTALQMLGVPAKHQAPLVEAAMRATG